MQKPAWHLLFVQMPIQRFIYIIVWLNGEYVGYTQGANNLHEFDLTKYLRHGDNRLCVQVFRWSDGSYLECQDMFRMSGIFRDVCLYNVPLESIRDHVLTASSL